MMRGVLGVGLLVAMLGGTAAIAADEEERAVPAEFAPFEYLIGAWKGSGVPTANRVKGWDEKHMWAWKFLKGVPVGLSLELEGDKTIKKGLLTYDAAKKQYLLAGTDPAGKPLTFTGNFDKTGKKLVLERVAKTDEPKEQFTLFPNAARIRYTVWIDQKEPGSPQLKRVTEIGVTKEGESFAAGSSASEAEKCILTGGAATLRVTYQGKSYPVCCTGCRDEFNDNPEKYVKKAALRAEQGGKKPAKAAASNAGKDDGAFEGLVDEPKKDMPAKKSATSAKTKTKAKPKPERDDEATAPAAKPDDDKLAAKAASALRIGQNLEKAGKTPAALKSYQDLVKSYPDTPSAQTAAERIKALGAR